MDKLEIKGEDTIEKDLELIHTKELIDKVKEASEKLKDGEATYTICPDDNYECKETYMAAKLSASATLTGIRDILDGKHSCGYAIVRPPGHHSFSSWTQGFCYFNNVSLAVKVAMEEPYNLKRICVFDWDIHHGDGT
jgi:histone deacetylase 6